MLVAKSARLYWLNSLVMGGWEGMFVEYPCSLLSPATQNEYDERQLRREITYAIKNIHGVRSGLFTPDEVHGETLLSWIVVCA